MVPSVLVEEGDNGFDVVLLDDVENFRALDEHTVQHLQDTCSSKSSPAASCFISEAFYITC